MRYFIIFLGFLTLSYGLEVGVKLPDITLKDQFDKPHQLFQSTKVVLFTANRDLSTDIKEFLSEKKGDFLASIGGVYIADISKMPSIITKLFALPSMRKYKFNILLLDEKYKKVFDNADDSIYIYGVENSTIKSIKKIKNEDELRSYFR